MDDRDLPTRSEMMSVDSFSLSGVVFFVMGCCCCPDSKEERVLNGSLSLLPRASEGRGGGGGERREVCGEGGGVGESAAVRDAGRASAALFVSSTSAKCAASSSRLEGR